jgi:RNA-directed DNA polymerase
MSNVSSSLRPEWATVSQEEFRKEFRDISSPADLARFWKIPAFQISYHAFYSEKANAYNTFLIPRRNGRKRRIEQPSRALKYIQRIVHESLTRVYGAHPAVHGFLARRSIVTNARNHLRRRYVLNIDLADFFPSITRQRIYGRLRAEPYSLNSIVANVIASLSTNIYGQLPQGSPSSPVIANIITAEMDADLAQLCGSLNCWYTRYADDITISTSRSEMSPKIARYPNARGTGQVIIGDELVLQRQLVW